MSDHLQTVDHGYIRYANCWEDADVLLQGLTVQPGDSCLSIASGGDNSFALLAFDPKVVVAVDVNIVQLHVCELKKEAIYRMEYAEFLEFIGVKPLDPIERINRFRELSKNLPKTTMEWWTKEEELIGNGIIHAGKFERYFSLFRRKIMPLIHRQSKIDQLLINRTAAEQKKFYAKKWDTWRWRIFFRFFFSRFVMGHVGRDPKFLKEVDISVSKFILSRSSQHLASVDCQQNYFLRYIFHEEFGDHLPFYLRKDNYGKIKKNIDRIAFRNCLLEDATAEFGKMDCLNLSNIFEYMDSEYFTTTGKKLADLCNPNARVAYWNLMVPRSLQSILPLAFELSTTHRGTDMGFFYRHFETVLRK